MKFKRIKMTNFMRYKGENEIEFSCNDEKNVTVILGNNTYGKTTIAQAFRWGLYGYITDTHYVKSKDVNLLNNEVLDNMDANSRETVIVEIEVEDGKYGYQFIRKAYFVRKFPQFVCVKKNEELLMRMKEDGKWSDFIKDSDKPEGRVSERIQMMFPQELASYFLFDGERWGDEKNTKVDIKDSINTIMGISPLSQMKKHLKDDGVKSVIKQLQRKIVGKDTTYEELLNERERYYEEIEIYKGIIKESTEAAQQYNEKYLKSEEIIKSNKKTEDMQKEVEGLNKDVERLRKRVEVDYAQIVGWFSKSYRYFAVPLMDQIIDLLKDVDCEGKDIPDITRDTIDFLLKEGRCLCGHEILPDSMEYKNLEALKKLIPPEAIGTIIGKFQDNLSEWKAESDEMYDAVYEGAKQMDVEKIEIEEEEERIENLNRKIDRTINFEQERRRMNTYRRNALEENEKVRRNERNIKENLEKIQKIEDKMDEARANTKENQRIQRVIAYAEALYQFTAECYKKKEEPLLMELNQLIKDNFAIMFKEKEKYAEIDEKYNLHLYYKNVTDKDNASYYEEFNLSEGELIARNFVFIVSILELAKRKKEEEKKENMVIGTEENVILNLPLVLDGPFSKLSDDNIALIAKVLPTAAEQVIIFMLDKDWEATNLSEYTDNIYMYRVDKESDAKSSSIVRG